MRDFRVFVLICVLLGGMGQGVVAPKLPALLGGAPELAMDAGISASLMYLGIFLTTYHFGRLADQGKVHWLLAPGLFAYAGVLGLLGISSGLTANFSLRLLEGICLSAIFVSADFVLGRLSASTERGRWLSYYGVAISAGLLLGPALALTAGRVAYFLGASPENAASPLIPLLAVAWIAISLGFFSLSRRVEQVGGNDAGPVSFPMAPLVAGAAYGFMEAGLVAVLPVQAVTVFHVIPEYCLVSVIISAALSSLFWGWLSDRAGPRRVVQGLLLSLATGPWMLIVIFSKSGFDSGLSPLLLHSACVLFGSIAGGLYPIAFSWLLEGIPESSYGRASGAFARAYGVGSLAGPLIGGLASQRWQSNGLLGGMASVGALAGVFVLAQSASLSRRSPVRAPAVPE